MATAKKKSKAASKKSAAKPAKKTQSVKSAKSSVKASVPSVIPSRQVVAQPQSCEMNSGPCCGGDFVRSHPILFLIIVVVAAVLAYMLLE